MAANPGVADSIQIKMVSRPTGMSHAKSGRASYSSLSSAKRPGAQAVSMEEGPSSK